MSDFKIEPIEIVDTLPTTLTRPKSYKITNYREATTDDGLTVKVESGYEQVTLEQLESQKANFQRELDKIQARIDAINKL